MLLLLLKRGLFIIGVAALVYAGFLFASADIRQRYEMVKFDRALTQPPRFRTAPVLPGGPIAKLNIPSVGISAIILEGVDDRTLDVAPGHIPGTALPGENGNVGIAAHRDTFFRKLQTIRDGDLVTLTTFEGVYHYKVESTEVVEPTRTDVLAPSGSPTLTLVTCYPFHMVGPAPKRYIVRGRFIQGETLSAAKQGTGSEQPSEQTASPALP